MSAEKECNCKFDSNDTSEIVEIPNGMCSHRKIRFISVDRCIARVIRSLLNNGIETLSGCCGHKTEQETLPRPFSPHPSLVIADSYSVEDCQEIADMIAMIDDRQWDIMQWKLVTFAPKQATIAELDKKIGRLGELVKCIQETKPYRGKTSDQKFTDGYNFALSEIHGMILAALSEQPGGTEG